MKKFILQHTYQRERERERAETISTIKNEIYNDERIVPYITKEELKNADKEFENLNTEEKKKALIKLVDKNKIYVNYSDIEDKSFDVSDSDKKFTNSFYKKINQ
ncbi:hypothetical protein [Mycoplasmopsis pulmonis]|uniref:hypothetical protein n=1 Tax=Mycoplasmopsis pulmonis TaxID=2107 RepID=UPI00059DB62E|nr:hypothetical protein [Mycoplasmopsis pulmonis]